MKEVFVKNNIIDFFPYGYRAVSTSKTKIIEVNIDDIIHHNVVVKIRKTFFKFYDKNIFEFAPHGMDFNRTC